MGNISPVTLPAEVVQSVPTVDVGMILLALLPFILFLIVVYWGLGHKERKSKVIELSYNLVAVQLLFFLLLPICSQPFDCGIWAVIPILMFGLLASFVYHRSSKEAQHKTRISKALKEGHVDLSGLLQGKLEDEIRKSKGKQEVKHLKKKITEGAIEVKKEKPKPKKKEPDHKRIERVVDSVINKRSSR